MLSSADMWDMPISKESAQRAAKPGESVPAHIGHFMGNLMYVVVMVILKIAFRYRIIGRENLREYADGRGLVLVGNHASYLDPALLWLSARPKQWVRFMARENMFSNAGGLAGQLASRTGAFPVKRDEADRTSIKRAAAMLKRGEVVGIFPEGTRRGRGTAAPELHEGAAFIARMGHADMLPACVRGAGDVKHKGERMHFPQLTVVYGKPVRLSDFDFLPKSDRLSAASWYVMRECYALLYDIEPSEVDMASLFPNATDYTEVLEGHSFGKEA